MGLRRRSVLSFSNAKRKLSRYRQPRMESLEARLAPAGLFTEDFSSDIDPALPGFDTAGDGLMLVNDLPPPRSSSEGTPTGRNGIYYLQQGHPGDPGWGLLADGHVLAIVSSAFGVPQVTFSFPAEGTPGGPAAGEIVSGLGISVQGFGHLQFIGERGSKGVDIASGNTWERIVADQNDLLPGGFELGPIRELRVYSSEYVALDILSAQVVSEQPNLPPVANNDQVLIDRRFGISEIFHPLDNDFDPDSDPIDFANVAFVGPSRGTVTAIDDQFGNLRGFVYEASPEALADPAFREDSFTYTIRDSLNQWASATVRLLVDQRPSGILDEFELPHGFTGPFDQTLFGGRTLLDNDFDRDGDSFTVASYSRPRHGQVTVTPDGRFSYTPTTADGRVLHDSFSYRLTDGLLTDDFDTFVFFQVDNEAPLAHAQQFELEHGETFPLTAALDVEDAEGDPLSYELVDAPLHGTVTLRADGTFTYVPTGGVFRGPDLFRYRVSDVYEQGELAFVHIQVPNSAPSTFDRFLWIYLDDPSVGVDAASDGDNDPLTGSLVIHPQHGRVTFDTAGRITYTPLVVGAIFDTDTFTVRFSDGFLTSSEANITVFQQLGDGVAFSDSYAVNAGETLEVSAARGLIRNDLIRSPRGSFESAANHVSRVIAERGIDSDVHRVDDCSVHISDCELAADGSFDFYAGFPTDIGNIFTDVVMSFQYRFAFPRVPGSAGEVESPLATVLIHVFPDHESHSDSDGVPDDEEDDAPFDGDIDQDGTPDKEQSHLASLRNAVDGDWVRVVSAPGTKLFQVRAHTFSGLDPAEYPIGVFDWTITGIAPGDASYVTLFLPPGVHPTTFRKFLPGPPGEDGFWDDFLFDGSTGAQIFEDRIVIHYVDGGRGDSDGLANGIIRDPAAPAIALSAPRVHSVTVNDGAVQRSMVTSLAVIFSEQVSVDPGAFELRKFGARHPVKLAAELDDSAGYTVARLTFKGAGIIGGSLADGQYLLTIDANKVRDADGEVLDGDGDGIGGGEYTEEIFRRFGDTDGDGDVDGFDRDAFRSAFGKRSGQSGYLWYLDFNANRRIWAEDAAMFWKAYRRGHRGM